MKQLIPFGKYVLLERVSVGGMAEVFKARRADDLGDGKIIAIKRILPSMAEDADFIQMFIDEARISGQLHHPHIAEIYELGSVGESHFIAMEYVWGKDVLQIQNRFRRLKQAMPFPMAAFCAMKVAEALDYAHKKKGADGNSLGIIHRDVSPQNVLVSYAGDVKVIDFGIAKAASRSTKTQAGVLKGKFGYMSPEQVGGQPLDRRSDVFAIGTILYELLMAERLFVAESDFATLERVRNVDVPPPRKAVPACPEELERIILKALARGVDDRYQWAAEMQADLAAFLASLPQPFAPKDLSTWMGEHFSQEKKREETSLEEQLKAAGELGKRPSGPISMMTAPTMMGEAPASVRATISGQAPPPIPGPSGTQELDIDQIVADEEAAQGLSAQATLITNASLASFMGGGATPEQALAAAMGGEAEMSGESTRILGADEPRPGMPGLPEAAAAGREEIPSQATAILDTSTMNLPPMVIQPHRPAYTPGFGTATGPAPRGFSQLDANPPTAHVTALPYAQQPRKSTLGKDVFIGLLVALVLIGGGVAWRIFQAPVKAPVGTLVVMVMPSGSARVEVDGQERGFIEAGRALTLKEFPAGIHVVHVSGEAGQFADRVTLAQNDVAVVSAMLTGGTPKPSAATEKAATSPSPAGAAATVDASVAPSTAPAAAAPVAPAVVAATPPPPAAPTTPAIPSLAAGPGEPARVAHTATAPTVAEKLPTPTAETKPAATPAATPAKADRRHLAIKTDPAGAEVVVNGKMIGVTPVETSEIETGTARVWIRKKGYVTVARLLDFSREPDRTLDLKLVESGAASGGEKKDEKPAVATKEAKPADARETKPAEPKEAKPAAAAPAPKAASPNEPGFLVANTQPWAKVVIDGKDTGKTTPIAPRSKISLKPGKHVITFVADGKKFSFDVDIKPGEDFKLIKTLTP